jgi:hypothetical protein
VPNDYTQELMRLGDEANAFGSACSNLLNFEINFHSRLGVFVACGGRMESDVTYFNRRAEEERAAGLIAADARARKAHLELAERYLDFAASIDNYADELFRSAAG